MGDITDFALMQPEMVIDLDKEDAQQDLTHNGLSFLTTMDILLETKIILLSIILDQEIKIEIQSSVIRIIEVIIKFGYQKWLMVILSECETQQLTNVWKLKEDYSILIPAKNQIPIKCLILDILIMHQLLLLLNPLPTTPTTKPTTPTNKPYIPSIYVPTTNPNPSKGKPNVKIPSN